MNYINGLYSGFPHCCVVWYVYTANVLGWKTPAKTTKDIFGEYYDYENWTHGIIEYVQCPKCIKNRNHIKESEMKLGFYLRKPNNKIVLQRWIEATDTYEQFNFVTKEWEFYGTYAQVWEKEQQARKAGS